MDEDLLEEPRAADDITVVISSILSNDPARSVDALKKIQKVLEIGPEEGPASPAYQDLAEHTEGLIETITLQMAHVFERPDAITVQENFRLAKHLIQTLNAFCDHTYLAESLTVDILTSLLEELTLRLLQTDNSPDNRVKDLSRFINMIILRLFATGRRMSIFRCVLQCFKPCHENLMCCAVHSSLCYYKSSSHSQQTVLPLTHKKLRLRNSFSSAFGSWQGTSLKIWRSKPLIPSSCSKRLSTSCSLYLRTNGGQGRPTKYHAATCLYARSKSSFSTLLVSCGAPLDRH